MPNARAPGTDNLTASIFKEVPLKFREAARLELRLEVFNVLNRVQFAAPDTNVGDATFGQITAQANQPRQVQGRGETIFLNGSAPKLYGRDAWRRHSLARAGKASA